MSVSPYTLNRCILILKWSAESYPQHIACIAAVFLCLRYFHLVLAKQKEPAIKKALYLEGGKNKAKHKSF